MGLSGMVEMRRYILVVELRRELVVLALAAERAQRHRHVCHFVTETWLLILHCYGLN